jgi:hypothetical protein
MLDNMRAQNLLIAFADCPYLQLLGHNMGGIVTRRHVAYYISNHMHTPAD